jgi:hypothetical protein
MIRLGVRPARPSTERRPGLAGVLAALHASAADRVEERSQPHQVGHGRAGEAGRHPGDAAVGGPREPLALDGREQHGIDR